MIDTPGHVDFTYEVSRSLAACEGAVLLVDSAQGIEAQTLANLYLAMEDDLHIIPVLNKIDLPAAQPEKYAEELAKLIGVEPAEVLRVSGKTGQGCRASPGEIVRQFDPPVGDADAPARAMIFDSVYDVYRGVVTYVRVIDGRIEARDRIKMMSTGAIHELLEIGVVSPEMEKAGALGVGEVGYLITGVKDVRQSRVGDTVTVNGRPRSRAARRLQGPQADGVLGPLPDRRLGLPGAARRPRQAQTQRRRARRTSRRRARRSASASAAASSACCTWRSSAERLEREFNLDLISTAPNVVYRVFTEDGIEYVVTNPSEFPTGKIAEIHEPVVRATVLVPERLRRRGHGAVPGPARQMLGMEYLSADRVELRYTLPLAEIIFDFFDQLKSRTKGYASLDYEPSGEQVADLVKVDILLHGEPVDAFSAIVHKDKAYNYGVSIAAKLQKLIPRQQFEVPIQAAIGSRIIARETIRAIRKDVLAKCYGGDITRKRKLLEKQKEGKKRMKMVGRVEVPQEAFIAALSTSDSAPDTRAPARNRAVWFLASRSGNHGVDGRNECTAPEEDSMTVTGIITALIIGLIIGALGRLVVPGKQNIPIWLTMVIGVVAALLGTVIARAIGVADTKGVDWIELLFQVVLAAIGVALVVGVAGRRRITR